ncbi:MAG TPA: SIR2 family protein [Spirochaetota bacterium]|jgi:hypothetical protein|nr:MAG: hypothetical protein BWX91_02525 [Spirochaetes bacterium ADurb.Bin133]HNZ27878.1 SIR2 family protein [Spirochaetota bacterium]
MSKTLLLGNGINRYIDEKVLSWDELLLKTWHKFNGRNIAEIPEAITHIEFMELLFHNINDKKRESEVKKFICREFEVWKNNVKESNSKYKILENIINKYNNIITTNYDNVLSDFFQGKFMVNHNLGFSDYYPWRSYDLLNGATKIFYIHGTYRYSRSIKISFIDYQRSIAYANKIIKQGKSKDEKDIQKYKNSLIYLFLETDLVIAGLKFTHDELFLRYLLFLKAKDYSNTKVVYITKSNNTGLDFLMENLGYSVIKLEKYEDIYKNLHKYI